MEEYESIVSSYRSSSKSSGFARLICRVNELTRKPKITLEFSQVLADFMQELHREDRRLITGLGTFNLVESALLLQGCSLVYGKNVDVLCDEVQRFVRHLVSLQIENENTIKEKAQLEKRMEKFKRRRRKEVVVAAAKPEACVLNDVLRKIDEQCKKPDVPVEIPGIWQMAHKSSSLAPSARIVDSVYTPDTRHAITHDIYSNNDLICRYEDLHLNTSLQSYSASRTTFEINYLKKNLSEIETLLDVDSMLQGFLMQEQTTILEMHANNDWQHFRSYCKNVEVESICSERLDEKCRRLCPKTSTIKITRLSTDVVKPFLSRTTPCDVAKKNGSCSVSHNDSGYFDAGDACHHMESDSGYQTINPDVDSVDDSACNEGPVHLCADTPKRTLKKRVSSLEDETPKKRKSRKMNIHRKTVTANSKDFESFYQEQYTPSDGEDCCLGSNFSNCDEPDQTCCEASAPDSSMQIDDLTALSSQRTDESTSNRDDSDFLTSLRLQQQERAKLKKWKSFLDDRLQGSDGSFDIHDYGSRIIDKLPECGSAKFAEVVQDNTSVEVIRYFVATMHLANTKNVELSRPPQGELANELLELRLLEVKRQKKDLTVNEAPSERNFRKRLLNSDSMTSTPSCSYKTGNERKRSRLFL